MYFRDIELLIKKYLNSNEIIIIYGARQTGKTTLLNKMFSGDQDALILNCERPDIKDILENMDLSQYRLLFRNKKVIALDEAQTIQNIGKILKLIYDSPEFNHKIIATGSSSFDLAGKISEPLTGRNIKFRIFQLSYNEIAENKSWLWCMENMEELLIYGSYPGIIDKPITEKELMLSNLASDYLYKDIFELEQIRNHSILRKLVKALSWQIGSQVSYNEIANMIGTSMKTVEKYIDLLEKSFVVFGLSSFNKNLRNEIKKSRKYYFYDNGIRNAAISNFSPLTNRQDKGALWENFCMSERIKYNSIHNPLVNVFFWRTYDGGEIDLVEEKNERVYAFEFKYNPKSKVKIPKSFVNAYHPQLSQVVTLENVHEFLMKN